ncbi:MAG: hypothetical protein AcusKO_12090 [Acuticoccus sp.]
MADAPPIASVWRRFAATLADLAILASVLAALAGLGVRLYTGSTHDDPAAGTVSYNFQTSMATNVVVIAYFFVLSAFLRRTPGKWLLSLEVISADNGTRVGVGQHIGRTAAVLVSLLTLTLGYFWLVVDRRRRTFHDKLASTLVVRPGAANG